MKRILIVEDNKTLAKLIAKKIEYSLKYTVDVAYTLLEAKLFLKRYDYFVTLLDINLPDAPNGEIVDYVLSKDDHAIVLSANIDKDFRKKMLQKNIIDYVNKSGVDDINYIIQTLERLQKNQKHKILVVDDSMVFRKSMKHMLENLFFTVIAVAHGEEALNVLETNPDISLVITDYNMPVMNGLELTNEIRKKHNKTDLCIIAISSDSNEEINAMFLKQGANDYINKPFSKEEFSCRINNSIEALENIQLIINHANRDFLTGLYNRSYFFTHMQDYMEELNDFSQQFAMAIVGIDSLQKINDHYGHDVADNLVVFLSEILRTTTNYKDIVIRFSVDEFFIILKDINQYVATDIFERLIQVIEQSNFSTNKGEHIKFTVSIGVSIYKDETLQETINKADMMLHTARKEGKNKIVFH